MGAFLEMHLFCALYVYSIGIIEKSVAFSEQIWYTK
jgi:hypothetical protein